jgi:hypothetical protein
MPQNYGNNFYTPKRLDHSFGHAFLSAEGDIFYSPNSSRRVDVPAHDDRYPFYVSEARFENFLSPRWWQKPYHYFSFIPLRPFFEGAVFGCLRDLVSDIEDAEDNRFALSPRKIEHWLEIEDSLILLAHHLNKGFFTRIKPGLTPIPPSILGFKKTFSTLRAARLRIAASRDWFLMWISLISSKIADIETSHEDWFSYLAKMEWPQDWLSTLQSSLLCDFSWHCPRVGTFLNIQNPSPEQPSVEWFYSWDIPVWYRPSQGHPELQPPPHILQLTTTFISKTPSHLRSPSFLRSPSPSKAPSPPPPTSEYSGRQYERAQKDYLATKPWMKFFATREERRIKILAKETPGELQTRLNRERKPPTKSADVFVWEWSVDGVVELVRRRVNKVEREDVLGSHSDSQCVYDSVLNIWDVCDYFGPDNPDDDDDDDDCGGGGDIGNDSDNLDVGSTDPETVQAFIDERIDQSSIHRRVMATAPSEVDLTQETHEADHIDILRHMSHYYGFVPPLPLPAADPVPIRPKDWEECLKSVGLQSTHNPSAGLTGPIMDFVTRLQRDGPQSSEWDILPGNRQFLNRETIVNFFHKINDGLFLVNSSFLVDGRSTDWQIAVLTSVNALYILRYIVQFPEYPSSAALARHLAREGIPFNTLLKLDPFSSSIPLNALRSRIPRRDAHYRFTVADFGSYVAERKQLLATPRARAAVLKGGIVGRLAKEHLDVDSVVFGPSSAVTAHRLGYSVVAAGTTYWDDGLSDDELAIICGLYCCYTGIFTS